MTCSDTIEIELGDAERHVFAHLLDYFIHTRVYEAVQFARTSTELEAAADRVRRLAQLKDMAWENVLPRADVAAQRADLLLWVLEAEQTAQENVKGIAEEDEDQSRPRREREESIESLRDALVVDYAHRCVCEEIVRQLDAARETVA